MRLTLWAIVSCLVVGFNGPSAADDRLVRLSVPEVLVESGLMKFMLPRFSLKTQVRVQIVAPGDPAEAALGADGTPVFTGAGRTWALAVLATDHPGTVRFADWITSEVGQRAITGFQRDGSPVFTLPVTEAAAVEMASYDGDPEEGRRLSIAQCGRCHVSTAEDRMRGIGSTPSFFVLRSLEDWEHRFSAFYTLKPHPAFTQVREVTDPFPADRPPPIVPVEITLDDLDAILAYVSRLEPADLGAPLQHQ